MYNESLLRLLLLWLKVTPLYWFEMEGSILYAHKDILTTDRKGEMMSGFG